MTNAITSTNGGEGSRRAYRLEILLVSFAGLLLEISYTRIVSFKLFYYYTYLIIGLALLGIGTGGVIVTISKRLHRASSDAILCWSFLLGAASILIGYIVIAITAIDTLAIWEYGTADSFANVALLVVICLMLFLSFIAVGVVVSTLFGRRPDDIGKLYFADLLGAGIACAIVVSLIGWIGPPSVIMLAGLVMALCGLRLALRDRPRVAPVAAVLSLVLLVAAVAPSLLPRQHEDAQKVELTDDNTVFSAWSPIFRVDVVEGGPGARILYHDALHGSGIYEFDGDVSELTRFDTDPRLLPFDTAGKPPDDVMIIGAAGGNEVLASLYFDAGQIDAIELNPVTYDLVTDEMADYSGHLAEHPKVNYVNGDGRSYLARSDKKYDLIWYPAPDSYSAANNASAGAFVLSESYLYTREQIEKSLEHLTDDGILAVQYGEFDYDEKPNRTARYITTAREALENLGIDDPAEHILVSSTPLGLFGSISTILVKRTPFTEAEVERFVGGLDKIEESRLRWAPGQEERLAADAVGSNTVVEQVASMSDDELEGFYDEYPDDITPISDDAPFFWHFNQFDDVIASFTDPIDRDDFEDSVGERVLLLLLAVAVVMAAVFLLLPFVAIRETWLQLPHKRRSFLYFSALGFGFIFFEVTLIQRLTLFLGYPTYSLTVTLMSILLFTGIGALLSTRFATSPRRILPWLLGAIGLLTLFYELALVPLTDEMLSFPLAARVPITFVLLAPLGLCLGMFMPIGLGSIANLTAHKTEYVAWGWAVNGFASVVGSVLSTMLAMTFGFHVVMVVAFCIYVVAVATLWGLLPSSRSAGAEVGAAAQS